ncbi:MAG: hypothetical protein ABI700_00720 [Chloroflexota bacterium]
MPRSYGDIPTFATFGEHMGHDYDQSAISYVQDYADGEYNRAAKIAADERLAPQAKAQDIRAIVEAAAAETQQRVDGQLESTERQIAEAVAKAQRPLSAASDQVGALDYAHKVLSAKVRSSGALLQEWDKALKLGDKTTLRVLADFGESFYRRTEPKALSLPQFIVERQRQTEAAIASPEAAKARKDILRLEATRIRLVQLKRVQAERFKNVRIQNNQLVDGQELAQREHIRSRF